VFHAGVTINQAILDSDTALDRFTGWSSPWGPYEPGAWRELRRIVDTSGESWAAVLHQHRKTALFEALRDVDKPQTHRWGRRWEKGPDGKKAKSSPWDHSAGLAMRWLRKEVRNRIEAALIEDSSATPVTEDDALITVGECEAWTELLSAHFSFDKRIDPLAIQLWIWVKIGKMKTGAACRRLGIPPGRGYVKFSRMDKRMKKLGVEV
jgi:hypothetical protein